MAEVISSDENNGDSELKDMKSQLSVFGLDEDNLSKEEMVDLLKALNNSKSSEKEEELLRQIKDEAEAGSPNVNLKRRYLNVRDRRMPWSLLPSSITQAERARALAVYIKLMSINSYRQARQSPSFMSWPPPIQIVEESVRVQPLRSTRSGRSVPVYAGFEDDSSDYDFVVTKSKRRKISNTEKDEASTSMKSLSLKRKANKEDEARPVKDSKISDSIKSELLSPGSNTKNIFADSED